MNKKQLLNKIIGGLKKQVDPKYRDGERRFFKEPIKNLGVRLPMRRKVCQQYWPQVKRLSKAELIALAELMFKEKYIELATIASNWLWRRREEFGQKDFKTFSIWVDKYLDNWAKIDDFCTHNLGYLINQEPQLVKKLLGWTGSKNRWVKRAAAVSLIYPFRKKKQFLKEIFEVAERLLTDPDDMVQKGYGWMLKVASDFHQQEVFRFIMKHKGKMPRTALRYAIEKMPLKLKQQAMKK